MQLSQLLQRLSPDDLTELLHRRGFTGKVPANIGYLANDLARSVNLSPVFYELNRFQILLIKWLGRQQELETSWQDLVTAIDGRVSTDYLEDQLRGLRLWGLVDYDP